MKECRREFDRNWTCQSKVLRKLSANKKFGYYTMTKLPIPVWFEVPDPAFATFVAVKLGLEVRSDCNGKPTINN